MPAADRLPAGRSLPLEIVVDTDRPPAFFGLATIRRTVAPGQRHGRLVAGGVVDDNYTADTTPAFWGVAEANTIIRL